MGPNCLGLFEEMTLRLSYKYIIDDTTKDPPLPLLPSSFAGSLAGPS